ncbi:MAG TPA: winged helix DNA-binding protein [Candidatus Barnesiella excrementavium]|nr:winged helix DNA-binding protein [Candidatus Barnesiella excrementavium]
MESFCKIRDVYRAITDFEARFEKRYGLGLNEGSLLCALHEVGRLSSGDIAKQLNLTQSNASKVIRAVENKGLIQRTLGDDDKRQMYFSLTPEGERCLTQLHCCDIEVPAVLKQLL